MPPIRIWRVIVGTLVGTLTGMLAAFACSDVAAELTGQSGSLAYLFHFSNGLVSLTYFFWCALLPSILAAMIGNLICLGFKSLSSRAGLVAMAISSITGALVSTFIWTCVTDNAQGPNPLMLAGFLLSSLLAPLITARLSLKALR